MNNIKTTNKLFRMNLHYHAFDNEVLPIKLNSGSKFFKEDLRPLTSKALNYKGVDNHECSIRN